MGRICLALSKVFRYLLVQNSSNSSIFKVGRHTGQSAVFTSGKCVLM